MDNTGGSDAGADLGALIERHWEAECNVAINMHSSSSVISRNGFHDMSGTVFEPRSVNHTKNTTKEMVLSDNTGWNRGKLVFDLEGFRGGTVSDHAFMFKPRAGAVLRPAALLLRGLRGAPAGRADRRCGGQSGGAGRPRSLGAAGGT